MAATTGGPAGAPPGLSAPAPTAPGRLLRRPDPDPVLRRDRGREVLDLGLGQGPARALFRPRDAAALALAGRSWAEAAPLLAPLAGEWILDTPPLRIERAAAGRVGLHLIPSALAGGTTHAATTPVPPGLLPVAHVFPPHPARVRPGAPMAFDPARHRAFQAILARHGRADLWALKCAVLAQLHEGRFAPPRTDRHGQTVVRVALRQHLAGHGPPPRPWLQRFDRPLLRALEEGG